MADRPPAFQFYAADWLASEKISVMTLAQEGALIRLLAHSWLRGSIPADEASIRSLLKYPDGSAMAELMAMVRLCYVTAIGEPSRLVNPRQEKEREKLRKFAEERAEAGRKGAKSKWGNRVTRDGSANGSANGSARVLPMAKNGSSSSSSSSSSESTHSPVSEPDPVLVQVRQFFNSGPLVWTKPDQDKLIALVRARGWPWCDKAIAGRMSEGDGTPIQTLYKREFGKNGKASTPIALDPASSRKVKI